MTRKREFLDYLADIHEASENISHFIEGMTWAQFAQDQKTIYAVVRAFEIIGEAAKKVLRLFASDTRRSRGSRWLGCGTS